MKSIDLHGTKHEDVKRKLDIFFWEMMCKNVHSVEVITGCSSKMKKIVYETASDYGIEVIEGISNNGCLLCKLV